MHSNGVRLRFIGDRQRLSVRLQAYLASAEARTAANRTLSLNIAMSYGVAGTSPVRCASWPRNARQARCGRPISPRSRWQRRSRWPICRSGSFHPHRRRAPHQQFPLVESGLYRVVLYRLSVAGLRCRSAGRSARVLRRPRTTLRAHRRADAEPGECLRPGSLLPSSSSVCCWSSCFGCRLSPRRLL